MEPADEPSAEQPPHSDVEGDQIFPGLRENRTGNYRLFPWKSMGFLGLIWFNY